MALLSIDPTARVRDVLRRIDTFIAEEVAPLEAELAAELERIGGPHPELGPDGAMARVAWDARREVQRRSAARGFYSLHLSPELGGAGFSRAEMFHVEEHVYRHGAGLAPALLAWTEGPSPGLLPATPDQLARFIAPLVNGEITAAFANTEPTVGSDVLNMQTRAVRDGGDWVLNGEKRWITNAPYCDVALVIAVTEPGAGSRSLSAFLVPADTPGFSRGPVLQTIMDDGLTGSLLLEDVRLPDANRLGEVGQGFAIAMTWINWRRMCRGGMCSGWSQLLIDRAVERTSTRRAFGGPLHAQQAVGHLLADMHTDWYAMRATSLLAQAELDQHGPYDMPLSDPAKQLISTIKVVCDEAFFRIADRAVQLHGAAGVHRGTLEEKLFRVARNLRIPAGTVEIQRNQIARQLVRDSEHVATTAPLAQVIL
jgi:alkylation response protein AidB-like acyl-CoA dehydrogenase